MKIEELKRAVIIEKKLKSSKNREPSGCYLSGAPTSHQPY
jgi:hypothetical protein